MADLGITGQQALRLKKKSNLDVLRRTEEAKQRDQFKSSLEEFEKFTVAKNNNGGSVRDFLYVNVLDVAEWRCPKFMPQDWDNTPLIVVKTLGYLLNYNKAVASEFYVMRKEESPKALKLFAVENFDRVDAAVAELKRLLDR